MRQEKTTLEIIAPTIEDAIQRGLNQLGLSKEAVDIEILDSGSKGLFGLGGRQARVRLAIKPTKIIPPSKDITSIAGTVENCSRLKNEDVQVKSRAIIRSENDDEILKISNQIVKDLLDKMKVKATVSSSYYTQPDQERDEATVLVNIQGDDLSILIGRRSETLNALQYIAGLIINKQVGRLVPLMIDVQGFRTRRERQLRQIARKMAEQTIATGRRQVLEPMPANERRLIHLELRNHSDVFTESIGEDPNRKVTILPKKTN